MINGMESVQECLNPYSNGICSMRGMKLKLLLLRHFVLILILMEYAL